MKKLLTVVLLVAAALAARAQTPAQPAPSPPAAGAPQAPRPSPQAPRAAAPARRLTLTVLVTDPSGRPLQGVDVTATGLATREGTSPADGLVRFTNLQAGTYRLRFESPAVVTFEREVTLRAGQNASVDVTLSAAPPPPPPPPPPAAPSPAPTPTRAVREAGEVRALSVPDVIDKNFITRKEPIKETPLGTTAGAETRLVQVREPIKERSNGEADETIYVVAGEAAVRLAGRTHNVEAGWLIVIPRGTSYTIEKVGRNPLVVVSVVTREP
jgi:mannose-6-phosphate isomerase-like protein (cupin superfamily)